MLSQQLREHISACFTGLWVQSFEHQDALAEIGHLCRQENWRLATWDIDQGLQVLGSDQPVDAGASDPVAAIRSLAALASPNRCALLVLPNFHRFLSSAEIIQAIAHQISAGKQNRTFVVVLSSVVQIPTELEKQFVVLEHELPGRQQLEEIVRGIATEDGELPQESDLARVLDSAAGLTRYEAEGAFSLSLVRHGHIASETIWQLKGQMLKKSGLLTLHRGGETFGDLGGLAALKAFCLKALTSRNPSAKARGILLLGVPGTGKSCFAKALGNEVGRPTVILDIGSLMGGLVGQTEEQTRRALRTIDAMGSSVTMVDEAEKALSGAAASGQTDSGVSARMFGSLLSWLSDRDSTSGSDSFVICTANDVSKLPPEFSRAERFDGIFFLDLPGPAERDAIWRMSIARFGLDAHQARPADTDWTGAEIRSCCRLAALLEVSLVEAAQNVVPVAKTASEAVERLRSWADGRCLSAERPGIYRRSLPAVEKPRRKIKIDPSNN